MLLWYFLKNRNLANYELKNKLFFIKLFIKNKCISVYSVSPIGGVTITALALKRRRNALLVFQHGGCQEVETHGGVAAGVFNFKPQSSPGRKAKKTHQQE